jgi:hypothetical protein
VSAAGLEVSVAKSALMNTEANCLQDLMRWCGNKFDDEVYTLKLYCQMACCQDWG